MSYINILSCATVVPPHSKTTAEILPFVRQWLQGEDRRLIEKAVRIFEMAGIEKRHSIMPAEQVFSPAGFGDKNEVFVKAMIPLSAAALEKAMEKAGINAHDIDCIITMSCTGIMIPSMDAYLINKFRMRQDILRLPVTEMGCAGGTSAMIYAHQFLKGNPGKKVAIVSFESPTVTMQHNDHSMTNIVSAALFGDGVAAVILENNDTPGKVSIEDGMMVQTYDQISMMGFKLTNSGLNMVLEAEVPDKIELTFDGMLEAFLNRSEMKKEDIGHLLFHPGGRKIVEMLESKFEKSGQKLGTTKEILYHYGNMSSATVLYILERYMNQEIKPEDKGLMLSFGPGFTTQFVLLNWH